MTYVFGVDAASWQGEIDCHRLRAEGHDFLIEKCTGEDNYINPMWLPNRDAARAAGLLFGSYDWVEPQTWRGPADAAVAAQEFVAAVGPRWPGELLCVDFETPDWYRGPLGHDIEAAFRHYIGALLVAGGQPVIVYTGPYFLDETGARTWAWLGQTTHFWIAAPGAGMLPDNAPWPSPYPPYSTVVMHQHQWYAQSPAIVGNYDRDRFLGTRADLARLGYQGREDVMDRFAAETITPTLNSRGELVVCVNFGGYGEAIEGINVQDLGGSVRNAGVIYDRSVTNNQFGPWVSRPPAE